MEHSSFFPRSKRNRIALWLALLSLVLFVAWNLMPNYQYNYEYDILERKGYTFQKIWPDIIRIIMRLNNYSITSQQALLSLMCGLVIFHAIVMISLIPAWKFWQSSSIVRIIPSVLISFCGGILIIFLMKIPGSIHEIIPISFMTASIFTTALSLLCFKNEWTEPDVHGTSST